MGKGASLGSDRGHSHQLAPLATFSQSVLLLATGKGHYVKDKDLNSSARTESVARSRVSPVVDLSFRPSVHGANRNPCAHIDDDVLEPLSNESSSRNPLTPSKGGEGFPDFHANRVNNRCGHQKDDDLLQPLSNQSSSRNPLTPNKHGHVVTVLDYGDQNYTFRSESRQQSRGSVHISDVHPSLDNSHRREMSALELPLRIGEKSPAATSGRKASTFGPSVSSHVFLADEVQNFSVTPREHQLSDAEESESKSHAIETLDDDELLDVLIESLACFERTQSYCGVQRDVLSDEMLEDLFAIELSLVRITIEMSERHVKRIKPNSISGRMKFSW